MNINVSNVIEFNRNEEEEKEKELDVSDLGGLPSPPEFLSFEAKMEWLKNIEEITNKGKNIGTFENYCIAMGNVRELNLILQIDGKIINKKPHPAYNMMLDAMKVVKVLGTELGFNEKEKKNNLKEPEEENKSSWDEGLLA